MNNSFTRRQFIKGTAVAAGTTLISSSCGFESFSAKTVKTAVDRVTLGNTGIKLSRMGIGAGTNGGQMQRNLGREGFNSLIRYAYDQGINYIDTADSYQTHTWVRDAIKGIPREKLFIQSKVMPMGFGRGKDSSSESPLETIDRFRKELNTDYIDSMLIHCQLNPDWDEQAKPLMEAMEEARQKKIIGAHGVSCHSLPALRKAAALDWVNVNLVRINPQGINIDTPELAVFGTSNALHVPAVVEQLKLMRENGHGIIGMKLIGEGAFTDIEDRRKSLTWVMQAGITDAVVIGCESRAEIDEAIMHINNAFKNT